MRKLICLAILFVSYKSFSQIRITEYMYDGSNAEFIEFTNVGNTYINMSGWSFDDDSRLPGTVSLSAFGVVRPGESVILSEAATAAFRTAWNLCSNVKVIGSLGTNLGRNDEINLFDASNALVDRLTFGDQNIPGSIRTQGKSGWVNAAGLGTNTILNWSLSVVADAEGSYTSTGGDIGSPGKSTRATIPYNPCLTGTMRITEYMYDGANAEFIEFTNVGITTVDMTGWSYDDDSRLAGTVSLSAFGIVQPGESVILAEAATGAFRTAWGLCNGVKIIGGLGTNLGRNDEINLFDASTALVDRLTYGDQNIPGSIRTQNKSGWVNVFGVGTNTILNWTLSANGDTEGSYASSGGDIASPGKSTRAIVTYDPCFIIAGAPVINIDVATTSDYLDGGAITSPVSPYPLSGVVNDVSDPAATSGIAFTISDDATPVGSLTVTATSSNNSVVPNANLILTGTGASRNLKITPSGVGYSNITVTVNDGTYNTSYVLNYAGSTLPAPVPGQHWHTGIADASAAIALDDNYMIIANDETNLLYVYNRTQSGLPAKTFDFNQSNILTLTDGSPGNWKEVDVEAGVNSIATPGKIYWLGSLSNSSNSPFENKPNRNRLMAVTVSGTGAATSFADAGHYNSLRQALISWGDTHGYDFTTSAVNGHDPKLIDGFNVEGMAFGPDNTTMYIGFRAPLIPMGNRTKAVIAPIENFETWFNNGSPAGAPVIGLPIELDLGGRGIRDIIRISNGNYIILAGSYDEASLPAIFRWNGHLGAPLVPLNAFFNIVGLNIEGVMPVIESGQPALNKLQLICDDGNRVYYGDGIAAKDLSADNFKKFSSDLVISSIADVLPVNLEYFVASKQGNSSLLKWKTGIADDVVSFEIYRSYNGRDFLPLNVVAANQGQTTYSFADNTVSGTKVYYKIKINERSGKISWSSIRSVSFTGTEDIVKTYPNPVIANQFSVVVNKSGLKNISIYSADGRLFRQYQFTEQAMDIYTHDWSRGLYWMKIVLSDGEIVSKKISVQ